MLLWSLVLLTLVTGLFLAAVYTEAGQLLALPIDWFYGIYPFLPVLSGTILAAALLAVVLGIATRKFSKLAASIYLLCIIALIFLSNWFTPEVWLRSQHRTAHYISIEEVGNKLSDDADMFVIEINGDARAYYRDWLMVPHIGGDLIGGEDVMMAYCALSNVPQVFGSDVDGAESDMRVIAQVGNNLVMGDSNTGILYQHITGQSHDGASTLTKYPVQRMPWASYKALYPDGKVYALERSGPLLKTIDNISAAVFTSGLTGHYSPDNPEPLYATIDLNDNRLHPKTTVWGVSLNNDSVAFTQDFFAREPVFNTVVGNKPVVIVWFDEYQTMGLFSRETAEGVVEVTDIDPYGNTPEGQLERLPMYPALFWMIWSHWYPETDLMKARTPPA